MSELLSYLDEIPVIRNDLGVSVRKYSEAYGRMVTLHTAVIPIKKSLIKLISNFERSNLRSKKLKQLNFLIFQNL